MRESNKKLLVSIKELVSSNDYTNNQMAFIILCKKINLSRCSLEELLEISLCFTFDFNSTWHSRDRDKFLNKINKKVGEYDISLVWSVYNKLKNERK